MGPTNSEWLNSDSAAPRVPAENYHDVKKNFTHDLVYFAEIGIGTPSQRTRVLVDISSPETFITSASCIECTHSGDDYDPSRSSTSEEVGTPLNIELGSILVNGSITLETFDIGGHHITHQPFLEATTVQPIGLSWDDMSAIHGILGLTPSSTASTLQNMSPFQSMSRQKVLDRDLFSMRLREPREILFGAVNETAFRGDLVEIPLTNKTGQYALTGRWQAEASYMALGSIPGIRYSLAGYTAAFSTSSAFMLLPDDMVFEILTALEFEDIMFLPPSIDCNRRKFLPELTFNLAGRNFTLAPDDYTFEFPIDGANTRCVSALMPFGVEQHDEIVLGSAFLRAFYSVFDLEKRTISCKH